MNQLEKTVSAAAQHDYYDRRQSDNALGLGRLQRLSDFKDRFAGNRAFSACNDCLFACGHLLLRRNAACKHENDGGIRFGALDRPLYALRHGLRLHGGGNSLHICRYYKPEEARKRLHRTDAADTCVCVAVHGDEQRARRIFYGQGHDTALLLHSAYRARNKNACGNAADKGRAHTAKCLYGGHHGNGRLRGAVVFAFVRSQKISR